MQPAAVVNRVGVFVYRARWSCTPNSSDVKIRRRLLLGFTVEPVVKELATNVRDFFWIFSVIRCLSTGENAPKTNRYGNYLRRRGCMSWNAVIGYQSWKMRIRKGGRVLREGAGVSEARSMVPRREVRGPR